MGGRSLQSVVWLLLVTVSVAPVSAQRPAQASESSVKAAYVYQFGTYVEWPVEDDPSETSFPICLLGQDPFGRAFDDLVRSERIGGQPIVIRRLSDVREAAPCRILFIAQSEDARVPAILRALQGQSVLTVSDGTTFLRRGGMIAFTVQDRKVRFAVNLAVAMGAGLNISSQLLRHAVEVRQ